MRSSKMSEYQTSRGIYKPIRVCETPIFERALQVCWHVGSYKVQIAVLLEMLRLQQKRQLPSAVSVKDMCDLLVEESKTSLRVQLWEYEIEDMEEEEAKPLLQLVWEVINSMKMRDIEFEARMLLHYRAVPPNFNHPRITSQAQEYAKTLTEQLQKPPSFKLLGPQEVVLKVVPKILQGVWLPPPDTFLNMPSQQLSAMAVGVTKAVLDQVSADLSTMEHQSHFFCATIDAVILSVLKKIKQNYSPDVLKELIECFAVPLLQNIVDTAAGEICELFEPRPVKNIAEDIDGEETSPSEDEELGLQEDSVRRDVSPVITPPPAPLSSTAEAPAQDDIQNVSLLSLDVVEEQPAPSQEAEAGTETNSSASEDEELGLEEDSVIRDVSPVITPPPAPLNFTAEAPAQDDIQNVSLLSLDVVEEQPAPSPEAEDGTETNSSASEDEELGLKEDSVRHDVSPVITPPPASLTLAAQPSGALQADSLVTTPPPPMTPADKPAAQEELTIKVQPVEVDEMVNTKKESRGFRQFFGRLRKNVCCCFWPGVNADA